MDTLGRYPQESRGNPSSGRGEGREREEGGGGRGREGEGERIWRLHTECRA